jgi:hypothetical protein
MTTKGAKKESPRKSESKEMAFKCSFCNETKPYSEMVILPRFFPPLPACRSCALKVEYAPKAERSQEA